MTKLSDTQLVILTAACQRDDRLVLPLPDRLKGGAATKVVGSLIAKGLIREVDAKRGKTVWRDTGDGHEVTLVVTDAAFAALGIGFLGRDCLDRSAGRAREEGAQDPGQQQAGSADRPAAAPRRRDHRRTC